MTKNNATSHKRMWNAFANMLAAASTQPGYKTSTAWLGSLGASMVSPDSLARDDVCSTCSAPGAWVAKGCALESGAFGLTPANQLHPHALEEPMQARHELQFPQEPADASHQK